MDNRVFNINGRSEEMLLKALSLVFEQESERCVCDGWIFHPEKGIILLWTEKENDPGFNRLPGLTAKETLPIVIAWLRSDDAKNMKLEGWDADYGDDDVTTDFGWRVYCEDWGHVAGMFETICAVTPAYMWYGK